MRNILSFTLKALFFIGVLGANSKADTPHSFDSKRISSEGIFVFQQSCLSSAMKKAGIKDHTTSAGMVLKLYCSCVGDAYTVGKNPLKVARECGEFAKRTEPKMGKSENEMSVPWNRYNSKYLATIQIGAIFTQCIEIKKKAKITNNYFCACYTDHIVSDAEMNLKNLGQKVPVSLLQTTITKCIDWQPK